MPGKRWASLKRPKEYEALRRKGYSKESSARISNADSHKPKPHWLYRTVGKRQ